jgi:hypothetical protein
VKHWEMLDSLPLLKRAWVFQERLLSPRVLHFTSQEMIFECLVGSWCECSDNPEWKTQTKCRDYSNPKHSHVGAWQDPTVMSLGNEWRKMVEEYSKLSLTFQKDKLPAISGLAKEMQPMRGTYLAGLWVDTFAEDLLWRTREPVARPQVWRGPTWSWISIDSPVWYEWPQQDVKFIPHAKFISWRHVPLGQDSTGEVESASATVWGRIISVQLLTPALELKVNWRNANFSGSRALYDDVYGPSIVVHGAKLDFLPDYDDNSNGKIHGIDEHDHLFCLDVGVYRQSKVFQLTEYCALLLRKDRSSNQYGRVGTVIYGPNTVLKDEFFKRKTKQKITII